MAVKALVIGCDWCEEETREFDEEFEAAAAGWWILIGPPSSEHADADAICELAFCGSSCRDSYFEYHDL